MSRVSSRADDAQAERANTNVSAIEALAQERGAEIVGGALIAGGVNWGMYTEDGFVPSAEALAVKAALDEAAAKERAKKSE
jgi:hypothetical protein